jgi:hypothetical protein
MKNLKNLKASIIATFIAFAIFTTSCNKEKIETTATSEETTGQEAQEGTEVGDEASNIADNAAKGQNITGRYASNQEQYEALSGCAVITRDTINRIITIDFGTSNCLGADGRNRRGKIIVNYIGSYFEQGSVKTITFDNYYRNDNKVEGTRTVTNTGFNASNQYTWKVEARNMKITRPDGKFHTWNSDRVRTMLAGYETSSWQDDEYTVTGDASGSNSDEVTYTATIITPLHRLMSCKWIDKGVIQFENSKGKSRVLDFGNGTCDNQATVEVTGRRGRVVTRTITLR